MFRIVLVAVLGEPAALVFAPAGPAPRVEPTPAERRQGLGGPTGAASLGARHMGYGGRRRRGGAHSFFVTDERPYGNPRSVEFFIAIDVPERASSPGPMCESAPDRRVRTDQHRGRSYRTPDLGLTASVPQARTCEVGAAGTCHVVPLTAVVPGRATTTGSGRTGPPSQRLTTSPPFALPSTRASGNETSVANLQDAADPQIS